MISCSGCLDSVSFLSIITISPFLFLCTCTYSINPFIYSLVGQPLSSVHGHIHDGVFDGEVRTAAGSTYHIEHIMKYPGATHHLPAGTHSLIYSHEHMIVPKSTCALKKVLFDKLQSIQATGQAIYKRPHPLTDDEYYENERVKRNSKKVNTASGGRFCQIFVAVDHLFLQHVVGGSEAMAISEVTTIFSSSQTIFQTTDFDSDGRIDAITPQLVRTDILNRDSYSGRFRSDNIDVNRYLNLWSEIDHSTYCLALLVTYR